MESSASSAIPHWIGGQKIFGGAQLPVISPIDEALIGHIGIADSSLVDEAVASGRRAAPVWRSMGVIRREKVLSRFADLIAEHADELAALETLDNGGLIRANQHVIRHRCAENIRFFARFAREHVSPVWHCDDSSDVVAYPPAGVAALISPWNAPLMLATWKLGPALAAGCPVVLKPSELAPLTCSRLGELANQAEIPAGVLNIIQGDGVTTGEALVRHKDIARISFTGSTDTARKISQAAAERLIPLSFELGGKSPLLVFSSADLDKATATILRQYFNAGQVCLAGTRILVESSIAEALLERVLAGIAAQIVGDPRDPQTTVGPIISRRQFDRVAGFVDRARADGATVLTGGRRAAPGGLYYEPTLIGNVRHDMEIVQSEVFGPVLTWQTFDDESQAVLLANGTSYGLAATLFTNEPAQAQRIASQLVAGTVWINSFFVRNLAAPFGGARLSGVGREGGHWSFDFFADVKTISVPSSFFKSMETGKWE